MPRRFATRTLDRDFTSRHLELGLERLEQRRLLAGNVTVVQLDNGDVRITGDNAANYVELEPDLNGDLRISGVGTTTINGAASQTIALATPETIQGNLIVNMRRGLDTLTVQGIDVDGRVSVKMGSGISDTAPFRSTFRFIGASIGDRLEVRSGRGDEAVDLRNVAIGGDVRANLGGGSDLVQFSDTTIGGEAKMRLGGGDDAIGISTSTATLWNVNTAAGDDLFVFANASGDMNVNSGSGDDMIWGACGTIGTSTWNLGSGNQDYAVFANDFSSSMSLVGGGGNDAVLLAAATLGGPTSIALGGDTDALLISSTTSFLSSAVVSGGNAADSFFLAAGFTPPAEVEFLSFEAEILLPTADVDASMASAQGFIANRWVVAGGSLAPFIC